MTHALDQVLDADLRIDSEIHPENSALDVDLEDNVGEQIKGVKGHTNNPFDTLDASNKLNLKCCTFEYQEHCIDN